MARFSKISRMNQHVRELQAAGEERPTGGSDLQSGTEVPDQRWDAKPQCRRKRERSRGKVRI